MSRKRRTFTQEFKVEAVRMVTEGGHRLPRWLGIWSWMRSFFADGGRLSRKRKPPRRFQARGHQKLKRRSWRRLTPGQ